MFHISKGELMFEENEKYLKYTKKVMDFHKIYIENKQIYGKKFKTIFVNSSFVFCHYECDEIKTSEPDLLIFDIDAGRFYKIFDKNLQNIIKIVKLNEKIYGILKDKSKTIYFFGIATMNRLSKLTIDSDIKDFINLDDSTLALYTNMSIQIFNWQNGYFISEINNSNELIQFNEFLGACYNIIYFSIFDRVEQIDIWGIRFIYNTMNLVCIHNPQSKKMQIETIRKDLVLHHNLFQKRPRAKEFYYIDLKNSNEICKLRVYNDMNLFKYCLIYQVLRPYSLNDPKIIRDILIFLS